MINNYWLYIINNKDIIVKTKSYSSAVEREHAYKRFLKDYPPSDGWTIKLEDL